MFPRATGLQGERGEIQPNRPSFGAIEQLLHLGVGELHTERIEQRSPFRSRHHEIVDTDLHDVAAGAKPCHGERWFGAGPERQPRAGREMEGELGDRVEALVVLERLDVVEDEDGLLHPRHRRCEARGEGGHRGTAAGSQHVRSDGVDPIEGGGGVGHQPPEIIVVPVDREPREASRVTPRPFGQERRLAVARRRGDDRDRHVRRIESFDEGRTRDQGRVGGRRMQLRLEEVRRAAFADDGAGSLGCAHRGRPPVSLARRH